MGSRFLHGLFPKSGVVGLSLPLKPDVVAPLTDLLAFLLRHSTFVSRPLSVSSLVHREDISISSGFCSVGGAVDVSYR